MWMGKVEAQVAVAEVHLVVLDVTATEAETYK
jgi:hypothetical protein